MVENKAITFWELLDTKVEIPIIQRDYAQGREDKGELRNRFLDELIGALDGIPVVLDFVYGSRNDSNNSMNPLDGQQRLTTLFLLYWYLAYRTGRLDDVKKRFCNFTYETRVSSRDFCMGIVNYGSTLPASDNLSDEIKEQTWFFSEWIQDPTIKSMLKMLDCIADKFASSSDKLLGYWEILTGKQCPISFYYLPLDNFGLSDDLYVKMNARGKPLTYFENFKADLINHLSSVKQLGEKRDNFSVEVEVNGKKMPYYLFISQKLDNEWTDIFWKSNREGNIDAIYLAFLNRYFLNEVICEREIVDNEEEYRSEDKIGKDERYRYLYGAKSDDSSIEYSSFDIYKALITKRRVDALCALFANLKDAVHVADLLKSSWGETFDLIPQYAADENKLIIKVLTQKQRTLFFAVTRYLETNEFNEASFKQWMRVVWNIVENSEAGIGCVHLIDELSEHSCRIYQFLESGSVLKSKFAKEQIEEEREKAKQILSDEAGEWESKIINAEKAAFFKGAIRFLFRKADMTNDWSEFDYKLEKSNSYFNATGVEPVYCDSAILLRSLIKRFDTWGQFWDLAYDNSVDTWKPILLNIQFSKPVNDLLMAGCLDDLSTMDIDVDNNDYKEMKELVYRDLSNSTLLENVHKGTRLQWRGDWDSYALYYPNCKAHNCIFLVGNKRNEVFYHLEQNGIIEVDQWQRIDGLSYYRGKELFFTSKINNKNYQWWKGSLKYLNESGEYEVENQTVEIDELEGYLKTSKC